MVEEEKAHEVRVCKRITSLATAGGKVRRGTHDLGVGSHLESTGDLEHPGVLGADGAGARSEAEWREGAAERAHVPLEEQSISSCSQKERRGDALEDEVRRHVHCRTPLVKSGSKGEATEVSVVELDLVGVDKAVSLDVC